MTQTLPKLQIKKRHDIRVAKGSPWIFSNEIENFSQLKTLEKGALVEIVFDPARPAFAIGYFNSSSLISCRILSHDCGQKIDHNFFVEKITSAKNLREKFFTKTPSTRSATEKQFYRLVHSEADFLPGLVIDCFGDVLSCQISTAGMERLLPFLISALEEIFPNAAIILRNDVEARRLEGLDCYVKVVKGNIPNQVRVEENDLSFLIDVTSGQKTGWFFDQRENRKFVGSISKNADVLDAFCYLGGFGLNALKNDAKSVTFIDSCSESLGKLKTNLEENNYTKKSELVLGKVFEVLENEEFQKRRFDIVVLDPPAFVKSKKDFFSGLKGYEKLVKLSTNLVRKNGLLVLSSCSHNASVSDLISAANDGFRKSGCKAKLIRTFGAGYDHPSHPALKESEYLKSLTFLVE